MFYRATRLWSGRDECAPQQRGGGATGIRWSRVTFAVVIECIVVLTALVVKSTEAPAGTVVHNPIEEVQVSVVAPGDGTLVAVDTVLDAMVFKRPGYPDVSVQLGAADLSTPYAVVPPVGDFRYVELVFAAEAGFELDHPAASAPVTFSLDLDSVVLDLDEARAFDDGGAVLHFELGADGWSLDEVVTVPSSGGDITLTTTEHDALVDDLSPGWEIQDFGL